MTQLFYLNRGYRCYDVGKSYSNTEYVGAKREAPDVKGEVKEIEEISLY
jgi:hypothetical protein